MVAPLFPFQNKSDIFFFSAPRFEAVMYTHILAHTHTCSQAFIASSFDCLQCQKLEAEKAWVRS